MPQKHPTTIIYMFDNLENITEQKLLFLRVNRQLIFKTAKVEVTA